MQKDRLQKPCLVKWENLLNIIFDPIIILGSVLSIGIPASLSSHLMSVSNIILNEIMVGYGCNDICHVLKVACGSHGLLQVLRGSLFHAVFVCRIADDLFLLGRCYLPCVNAEGDTVLLPEVAQDCLLVGGGRVFPECPHAAVSVAADIVVRVKPDDGRGDHVQKALKLRLIR